MNRAAAFPPRKSRASLSRRNDAATRGLDRTSAFLRRGFLLSPQVPDEDSGIPALCGCSLRTAIWPTNRANGGKDPGVLLFADGVDVVFEDIEVRPWEPVATVKRHHDFEQ